MADRDRRFRAACVQMRSGIDRGLNTKDALALISDAVRVGANFVTTPEMTNIVDRQGRRLLDGLPDESGLDEIVAYSEVAKNHRIWLLIGSVALREGDRAANRSLLYAPDGTIMARYDKLHMFDVDLPNGESWKESKIYKPGNCAIVANTALAKIGMSICYDVRFPSLYRTMAQAGAEVFCVPAAFTRQTGEAHWKTLLTARAIENGAFVIAPAQGGVHEDGRETYGHSLIVDPWGKILAEAPDDEPCIITADIDINEVYKMRQRIPNLSLEQEFEVTILDQ